MAGSVWPGFDLWKPCKMAACSQGHAAAGFRWTAGWTKHAGRMAHSDKMEHPQPSSPAALLTQVCARVCWGKSEMMTNIP